MINTNAGNIICEFYQIFSLLEYIKVSKTIIYIIKIGVLYIYLTFYLIFYIVFLKYKYGYNSSIYFIEVILL